MRACTFLFIKCPAAGRNAVIADTFSSSDKKRIIWVFMLWTSSLGLNQTVLLRRATIVQTIKTRGMKFTVFGATGPSGLQLVEESLEKGHEVTALVRNPDKLQIKHDNLTVEKVDISKEDDLVPHIKGRDAVMSCLGAQAGIFTPCSLYTDSIKTITGAMRKGGVTRFVGMSAWGTKYDPGLPWAIRWILRPLFLRNILPNMGEMEDYLTEQCQDIDFTVVRPPGLTDEKSSGKEIATSEKLYVPDCTSRIPRRDVAKFMLSCVINGEWKKKHVAVGIK